MSSFQESKKADGARASSPAQGSYNQEGKSLASASTSIKSDTDTFAKILDLFIKLQIISSDCHPDCELKSKNVNESSLPYPPPSPSLSVTILRLLRVLLFLIILGTASSFLIKFGILPFPLVFTGMIVTTLVIFGYNYVHRENVYKETGFDGVPLGYFIIVCLSFVPLYGGIMYAHSNGIEGEKRYAICRRSLWASISILIGIAFCVVCFTFQLRKWARRRQQEGAKGKTVQV
ncbi:unnamed protein product [Orchesella dallaii]|uniref:MARVEL domain-containing protein n=1 Tax=Orchesella dallaii TaxID=48710 RepID=A0ABP1RZ07_9HEXA